MVIITQIRESQINRSINVYQNKLSVIDALIAKSIRNAGFVSYEASDMGRYRKYTTMKKPKDITLLGIKFLEVKDNG